jgi:hypothetical protein
MIALMILLQLEVKARPTEGGYELSVQVSQPALPNGTVVRIRATVETLRAEKPNYDLVVAQEPLDDQLLQMRRGSCGWTTRVSKPGVYTVRVWAQREDQVDARIAGSFSRLPALDERRSIAAGSSTEWALAVLDSHARIKSWLDTADRIFMAPIGESTRAQVDRLLAFRNKEAGLLVLTASDQTLVRALRAVTPMLGADTPAPKDAGTPTAQHGRGAPPQPGQLRPMQSVPGNALGNYQELSQVQPDNAKPSAEDNAAGLPPAAPASSGNGKGPEERNRQIAEQVRKDIEELRRLMSQEAEFQLVSRAAAEEKDWRKLAEAERALGCGETIREGVAKIEKDASALPAVRDTWTRAAEALKKQ